MIIHEGENIHDFYDIGLKVGDPIYSKAYHAKHRVTKEVKAVKIYKKSQISNYEKFKKAAEMVSSFDHPNILTYSDFYEDEEKCYLVTDLMHCELFEAMLKIENFNENDAANIAYQMLSALTYLHDKGLVHKNIRPSNILVK